MSIRPPWILFGMLALGCPDTDPPEDGGIQEPWGDDTSDDDDVHDDDSTDDDSTDDDDSGDDATDEPGPGPWIMVRAGGGGTDTPGPCAAEYYGHT